MVSPKRQTSPQQPSLPGLFAPFAKSCRLNTAQERALEVARVRGIAAFFIFSLAWLVIAGRLVDLTLFKDAPELPPMRAEISDSTASRADITDRNGVALASSVPTVSLCADSKDLLDPDAAAKQLLEALPDLDPKKLNDDLHSGKHCAMIKRHLSPKQYYAVNTLGIAGLEFRPDERRLYPAGNDVAHVVGYTDVDNKGLAGMEQEFDTQLEEQQEPVALSLDLRVQTILHDELDAAMSQFHATGAAGLVMDAHTGEILGMVSLPDFDPAHPGTASDAARFNRDTLGVYEMGSTFKIFNTALALDSGLIHLGDSFDVTHPIEIGGHTIHDFESENRWLNVAEIFTHSSNIGSARMAERLGGARQRMFLTHLGLTSKVPLEFPETGAPLVPSARDWTDSTTMTAAYGQGIAVNAVQLAAAVATIVNDGKPVHPTLLKAGTVLELDRKETPIISAHTSALMRGLMRLVVTRGTGRDANLDGYMIGGKTGTADKIVDGHYAHNQRLSSFVGVFPVDQPRYLVFAMLDDPKGNSNVFGFATGGKVAAPVVKNVVKQIGPLLDIMPRDEDEEDEAERKVLKPLGALIVDGLPVDEGSHYASNESDSVR